MTVNPTEEATVTRQAGELRDAINDAIAGVLDASRNDGEVVSMTAIVLGSVTALADMVVTITPPGPLRTDVSMLLVDQLGMTLIAGAQVPNPAGMVDLIFPPSASTPRN